MEHQKLWRKLLMISKYVKNNDGQILQLQIAVRKKIVYTYAYYIQIFISEAIVKAEKQYEKKQGHPAKDHSELQEDTIQAIKEKEEKGHLPQFDVGRYDRREDRIGSGGSHKKA